MMDSYTGANSGTVVGSFISSLPIEYAQPPSDPQEKMDFPSSANLIEKPRILIMGMRRSGKSSIQKVVFHKMAPNETLFLESTNKIVKDDVSDCSFIQFQIWDFPGHINFLDREIFDFESVFESSGAIIFVIDSQDDYTEALSRLHVTIMRAFKANPDIKMEIFIHKVDGLNDDQKIETQRDINQRAMDDLLESGLDAVHLSFHLTTIYDHSIFEAFSKVVQKLIPVMGAFENLLNIFCSNSCLEKAFLFDIATKIYLATDYTPVDMQTYELCCDMIDVVMDVASIYGHPMDSAANVVDPPFTEETGSLIRLNNNTVLYMRGINKYLALVCIIRHQAMNKFGIIEYNYQCVKEGLQKILELRKETKEAELQKRVQQQQQQETLEQRSLDLNNDEDGAIGGTPIPGPNVVRV